MGLIGKTIRSRATNINGTITGIDKKSLWISFTQFQDVSIPLDKVETLLRMDEETLNEFKETIVLIKPRKRKKKEVLK